MYVHYIHICYISEVDKLREMKGRLCPVIITGDFNSNVVSPVYQLMMSGRYSSFSITESVTLFDIVEK